MKKLAIIIALMLVQTQITAVAANENFKKQPANKQQASQQTKQQVKNVKPAAQAKQQATPKKDDEYLLKYNIRDLEAAPWLHGGKRSYN